MDQANGTTGFEPLERLIDLEDVTPFAAHLPPPPLPVTPVPAIELCRACQADLEAGQAACGRCGAQRVIGMAPLPAADPVPIEPINVFQPKGNRTRTARWITLLLCITGGFIASRFTGTKSSPTNATLNSSVGTSVATGRTRPPQAITPIAPTLPPLSTNLPVAAAAPRPAVAAAPPGFERKQTEMIGGTTGGGPFERPGRNNEPVIGFRLSTSQWERKSILRTLDPIYASDFVAPAAGMVFAKPGYAVGGVYIDGVDHVNAISILFMRVEPDGLSTSDTYRSRWYGDHTSVDATLLGGQGERVIGIFGRKGMNVDALGLLVLSRLESASRE